MRYSFKFNYNLKFLHSRLLHYKIIEICASAQNAMFYLVLCHLKANFNHVLVFFRLFGENFQYRDKCPTHENII